MARRNPLFPYIYRLGMPVFDRLFYRRYRREAMTHAFGRLLMVGLEPGTDLLFLPAAVTSVAAVEPEAAMRRMHPRWHTAVTLTSTSSMGSASRFPFRTTALTRCTSASCCARSTMSTPPWLKSGGYSHPEAGW